MIELLAKLAPESVNEKNNNGSTPAHFAALNDRAAVIEALAELDSETLKEKNDFGFTPAHSAASKGHVAVLKVIAKHALRTVEAKDNNGATPLDLLRDEAGYLRHRGENQKADELEEFANRLAAKLDVVLLENLDL